jgi:hypothetical protein
LIFDSCPLLVGHSSDNSMQLTSDDSMPINKLHLGLLRCIVLRLYTITFSIRRKTEKTWHKYYKPTTATDHDKATTYIQQ